MWLGLTASTSDIPCGPGRPSVPGSPRSPVGNIILHQTSRAPQSINFTFAYVC